MSDTILPRRYFTVEEKRDHWELWCKRCRRGWRLEKPAAGVQLHPGNVLHLLNHAMSHAENRRGDTRGKAGDGEA